MQQYKLKSVSALTGSVPHNGLRAEGIVITMKNQTHIAWLNTTNVPQVRINLPKKTVHDSHLATRNSFFACRIVVLGFYRESNLEFNWIQSRVQLRIQSWSQLSQFSDSIDCSQIVLFSEQRFANSIKKFISHENKKWLVAAPYLPSI